MHLRHAILVTTALAGLAAALPSTAQTAPTASPPGSDDQAATTTATDAPADGDIIVTGYRGSLQKAINVKRNANAVVDVITSEDVGKFPDRNVAESLSHIPGVSIDRRFGEGEKVAILGTDPALNRMLLDGHALASADWGGNDNDPSSRTFNYSLLAPELVDRLEVYKSPEPRIEEGSLGGTVIVRTRRPLDLPANSIFASGGYSYNDRSDKGNARGSGLYSWRNADETFGVLVAATYDKQNLTRAGVEFFGYDNTAPNADGTYNSPFVNRASDGTLSLKSPGATITGGTIEDLYKAASPFGINYAYFQQQRERKSVSGTMQFRPSSDLTLTLNGTHIDGNYNNYSQSMYTIPGAWTGNVLQSATISNGVVTAASFGAATSQSAQLDTLVRRTSLKTDNLNLFADWEGDGGAKVNFSGGWSRAKGGRNPEYLFNVQTKLPYSYAFTNNTATVNFVGDLTNPANYFTNPNNNAAQIEGRPVLTSTGAQLIAAQIGGLDYSVTTDRDIFGGYDATIPVSVGPFTEILLGSRVTDHVNRVDARGINTYLQQSLDVTQLGVTALTTPDGTFDGSGGMGNATKYLNLPQQSVIDILANAINSPLVTKVGASTEVRETVMASYAQANFDQDGLRGNIGGRLVYTRDISNYATTLSNTVNPVPVPTRTVNDYLKFLPSLNIAYSITPKVIVRGAAARVIARPRYEDLAAATSLNNVTLDGGGGNPNLKPYESTNYELTAEYYPRAGSLLAVELFRREISNYIFNTRTNAVFFNSLTGALATYNVNQPINGGKAKVNGALISAQSDIWGGFGLQANYSYQESSTSNTDVTGTTLNLPYLSKHTVNVIPYFEKGPFQARVSYNYRSSYFRTIGRLGSREMVAPYSQLDASASLNITKGIVLSVNAQNLLDETYLQYNATPDRPTAFYKNGRTFAAAVSFRM
ncbi:TonB-dependent receptor [Sphingomonas sp. RIT328]|uniref:TonB-dependent receptor n=1 Tax=Sphingomonas sp. RIT328 TaxID=1470591 RepID=UPI00044D4FA6|nr:TonB-dependent receptor [Sphingomonas sp. RIT328]EZP57226.1 TonB-dependent receptor family protein [Sphingomonas sp. RIT328]